MSVRCPYCYEALELWVDPQTSGSFVEDCEVCCRPWQVFAERDPESGELYVQVARAQ
ncbi:MAG: CPXCG motif-containing cysteine-rich protein [Sandaracinaceae bacterium]